MIKSIKHKGLSKFHQTGNTSGIQSKHAKRLRLQLTILESAVRKEDLNRPGFNLHQLKGEYKGRYAISVSGNRRSHSGICITVSATRSPPVTMRSHYKN